MPITWVTMVFIGIFTFINRVKQVHKSCKITMEHGGIVQKNIQIGRFGRHDASRHAHHVTLNGMSMSPVPMMGISLTDDLPVMDFNHALSRFLWGHDGHISKEHGGRHGLHQQAFFFDFICFSLLPSIISGNHLYLKCIVKIQLTGDKVT